MWRTEITTKKKKRETGKLILTDLLIPNFIHPSVHAPSIGSKSQWYRFQSWSSNVLLVLGSFQERLKRDMMFCWLAECIVMQHLHNTTGLCCQSERGKHIDWGSMLLLKTKCLAADPLWETFFSLKLTGNVARKLLAMSLFKVFLGLLEGLSGFKHMGWISRLCFTSIQRQLVNQVLKTAIYAGNGQNKSYICFFKGSQKPVYNGELTRKAFYQTLYLQWKQRSSSEHKSEWINICGGSIGGDHTHVGGVLLWEGNAAQWQSIGHVHRRSQVESLPFPF